MRKNPSKVILVESSSPSLSVLTEQIVALVAIPTLLMILILVLLMARIYPKLVAFLLLITIIPFMVSQSSLVEETRNPYWDDSRLYSPIIIND